MNLSDPVLSGWQGGQEYQDGEPLQGISAYHNGLVTCGFILGVVASTSNFQILIRRVCMKNKGFHKLGWKFAIVYHLRRME